MDGWTTVEARPQRLSQFQYRARAVVDPCDARTVDALVLDPLLEQIGRIRQAS